MNRQYKKGEIVRSAPYVNMMLYCSENPDINYPIAEINEPSYSDFFDTVYSENTLIILSLISDYVFLGTQQIAMLMGFGKKNSYVMYSKGVLQRCVKYGFLDKCKLNSKGDFNGFYRGDNRVYYLTEKGLKFVKTFRTLSHAQETKIRDFLKTDENTDKYLMHTYGTYCVARQISNAFSLLYNLRTETVYESVPIDHFSKSEVETAEEEGRIAGKKKRGKTLFFDFMVEGRNKNTDAAWYVLGEYDRRTETFPVLRRKLNDYCSAGGYIQNTILTKVPSINNACILFACDSAKGYHDGPALNETKCKDVLSHMRTGTLPSRDIRFLREAESLEEFNKNTGFTLTEKLYPVFEDILKYYAGDMKPGEDIVTTYDMMKHHIETLGLGYNPMRIDTILDRERFYTLKRLLGVLNTFNGARDRIFNNDYSHNGLATAVTNLFGGMSCYFLPAVAVGYYSAMGVFNPVDGISELYRELVQKVFGLKGDEKYKPVSGYREGSILIRQPGDFGVTLNMRNTFYTEDGYVHVEDFTDLGAWLRVGAFMYHLKNNDDGKHRLLVLAERNEWDEFRTWMGEYYNPNNNIKIKVRSNMYRPFYKKKYDVAYAPKEENGANHEG